MYGVCIFWGAAAISPVGLNTPPGLRLFRPLGSIRLRGVPHPLPPPHRAGMGANCAYAAQNPNPTGRDTSNCAYAAQNPNPRDTCKSPRDTCKSPRDTGE